MPERSRPMPERSRPPTRARTAARRRGAETAHRREHLIDAAEAVFARRPYDEATMQEIAQGAGIGMNGLYRQFASKEELFEAVVCCRLEEVRTRIPSTRRGDSPVRRIRELARAYAGFFLERPHFFPMFAAQRLATRWRLASRFSQSTHPLIDAVEAELARAIAAAIKAGELAPRDPGLLSEVAMGLFISVLQYQLLARQPADADTCANLMIELFRAGVGGGR
jgi:AcrR family transcriptional regulator